MACQCQNKLAGNVCEKTSGKCDPGPCKDGFFGESCDTYVIFCQYHSE